MVFLLCLIPLLFATPSWYWDLRKQHTWHIYCLWFETMERDHGFNILKGGKTGKGVYR
jgi:hypothetical protein